MSDRDLSNKPKRLKVKDDKAKSWFYEELEGLEVIVELKKHKDYVHVTIPWRAVRNAIARKDK